MMRRGERINRGARPGKIERIVDGGDVDTVKRWIDHEATLGKETEPEIPKNIVDDIGTDPKNGLPDFILPPPRPEPPEEIGRRFPPRKPIISEPTIHRKPKPFHPKPIYPNGITLDVEPGFLKPKPKPRPFHPKPIYPEPIIPVTTVTGGDFKEVVRPGDVSVSVTGEAVGAKPAGIDKTTLYIIIGAVVVVGFIAMRR